MIYEVPENAEAPLGLSASYLKLGRNMLRSLP